MDKNAYYAIGDIHGRYDLLDVALQWIASDTNLHKEPFKIITLGDYVDRGPNSAQVIERLRLYGDEMISLMGNHEDMMIKAMNDPHGNSFYHWTTNGGQETISSYNQSPNGWFNNDEIKSDYEWMVRRPIFHETERFIFVHAGLYPEVELRRNTPEIMLWVREEFLHSNYDWGKYIVHGHTPQNGKIDIRKNRINLDSGAFYTGVLSVARWFPDTPVQEPFIKYFKEKIDL
jgi:serine/threonine protein phosphatase 1